MDKALAGQYEARVVARQRNLPFPERNPYQLVAPGRFPGALPESLKPKPGLVAQQRVYEDFMRLPKVAPMAARPDGAAGGQVRRAGGDVYVKWSEALQVSSSPVQLAARLNEWNSCDAWLHACFNCMTPN